MWVQQEGVINQLFKAVLSLILPGTTGRNGYQESDKGGQLPDEFLNYNH